MTFREWKKYFNTLSTEQRFELYQAWKVIKSDPKLCELYNYDIENMMYLLEDAGI